MSVFYTSDTHLGHRKVAQIRWQQAFPGIDMPENIEHVLNTRQLDVGLDPWGLAPVSEETLLQLMAVLEDPKNLGLALPGEAVRW